MINKTAVGYAYDSTKDSDKLKQQKQEIEQYCEDNGFQLQTVYMAGKSDGKSKEEIFKTFVNSLPEEIEYIIVSRLEGVTRDYLKYADIEKSLGGKRIVLTQVDDASNDLSTFFSKFKELGDEIFKQKINGTN